MELENVKGKRISESSELEYVLDQYKLYVSTAEKVSDRRNYVNTFYLTLTTSIVGVVGYVKTNNIDDDKYLVIGLSICAILICIYWISLLENYRKLNSGKFKVIHEIEKRLPLNLFDYEWEKLGRGKDKKLYKKMSNVEKGIPIIFGALFLFVIFFELLGLICQ
jgi:hypothetical protein